MTDGVDAELVAQLEEYRPHAERWLALEAIGDVRHRQTTKPTWEEMTGIITGLMKAHIEFGPAQRGVFIAGRQLAFHAEVQARNILSSAATTGAKEALAWYRKALATPTSDVLIIAEVHGLLVQKSLALSNGVCLVPVSELPDEPLSRALVAQTRVTIGEALINSRHPCSAIVLLEGVPATEDYAASGRLFEDTAERIRRSVTAFTIGLEHAPTVGAIWAYLVNRDLAAAEFGTMARTAQYDGRQETWPRPIDEELVLQVESILRLRGKTAAACDLALARINMAKRRRSPGDQAIEGCVALEALLSDKNPGELTYKLSLRSALLLGGSLVEREATRKAVKNFYQLRSKIVHGHNGNQDPHARETARAGLALCLKILAAVVSAGELPNVTELELMGGLAGSAAGSEVRGAHASPQAGFSEAAPHDLMAVADTSTP